MNTLNRLLALALPLAGQNILAFSLSLISVGFIGHLGKYELSVAVLATSLYNLTGNSVIQGMAGGMETLCGQVLVVDYVTDYVTNCCMLRRMAPVGTSRWASCCSEHWRCCPSLPCS